MQYSEKSTCGTSRFFFFRHSFCYDVVYSWKKKKTTTARRNAQFAANNILQMTFNWNQFYFILKYTLRFCRWSCKTNSNLFMESIKRYISARVTPKIYGCRNSIRSWNWLINAEANFEIPNILLAQVFISDRERFLRSSLAGANVQRHWDHLHFLRHMWYNFLKAKNRCAINAERLNLQRASRKFAQIIAVQIKKMNVLF